MKKIQIEDIKKVRETTGAPVIRAKKVLEEVGGDLKKAEKILLKEGFENIAKRSTRATNQGLIETYVHHSGKVASVVELLCETDFVARNDLFKDLAHNLVLQLASSEVKTAKGLLKEDFIKDPKKKVGDLVKEVITKTGENVKLGRIYKIELGK